MKISAFNEDLSGTSLHTGNPKYATITRPNTRTAIENWKTATIVVGCVALVASAVLVSYVIFKRRRRARTSAASAPEQGQFPL